MLPQEFFDSQRVFLRPSDCSFEASLYCLRHTEKYAHLKNEGAQPPHLSKWWEGGFKPPLPPLCSICTTTFVFIFAVYTLVYSLFVQSAHCNSYTGNQIKIMKNGAALQVYQIKCMDKKEL